MRKIGTRLLAALLTLLMLLSCMGAAFAQEEEQTPEDIPEAADQTAEAEAEEAPAEPETEEPAEEPDEEPDEEIVIEEPAAETEADIPAEEAPAADGDGEYSILRQPSDITLRPGMNISAELKASFDCKGVQAVKEDGSVTPKGKWYYSVFDWTEMGYYFPYNESYVGEWRLYAFYGEGESDYVVSEPFYVSLGGELHIVEQPPAVAQSLLQRTVEMTVDFRPYGYSGVKLVKTDGSLTYTGTRVETDTDNYICRFSFDADTRYNKDMFGEWFFRIMYNETEYIESEPFIIEPGTTPEIATQPEDVVLELGETTYSRVVYNFIPDLTAEVIKADGTDTREITWINYSSRSRIYYFTFSEKDAGEWFYRIYLSDDEYLDSDTFTVSFGSVSVSDLGYRRQPSDLSILPGKSYRVWAEVNFAVDSIRTVMVNTETDEQFEINCTPYQTFSEIGYSFEYDESYLGTWVLRTYYNDTEYVESSRFTISKGELRFTAQPKDMTLTPGETDQTVTAKLNFVPWMSTTKLVKTDKSVTLTSNWYAKESDTATHYLAFKGEYLGKWVMRAYYSETEYIESQPFTISLNPAYHTVTFKVIGDGSTPAAQYIGYGDKASRPEDPAPEGYDFDGWYTDADCTSPFDFGAAITGDITLYAKCTIKTFTVTFDANGHGADPAAQTVTYGKIASRPLSPVAPGWAFAGWYTDAACTKLYDFTTPVKTDLTLYANWEQYYYTITYDSNGGSGTMEGSRVPSGTKYTLPECGFTAPSGQKFVGWYVSSMIGTYQPGKEITVDQSITIKAMWKTMYFYTVSFDTNGHGTAPASQTVEAGTLAEAVADPAEDGWVFLGWYTSQYGVSNLDSRYEFNFFTQKVTSDMTLYAAWRSSKQYTITVEYGGAGSGTVELSKYIAMAGETITVTLTPDAYSKFDYMRVNTRQTTLKSFTMPAQNTTVTVYFTCDHTHNQTTLTEYYPAEAPICTNDGQKAYYECSVCGKKYEDARGYWAIKDPDWLIDPATGHDWDDGEITTAPTCENPGVLTYTCKNDSTHTDTVSIPPLGHNLTFMVAHEPTCEQDGYEAYYLCLNCDRCFEDSAGTIDISIVVKPATGHVATSLWENETPASCTKDGSYDEVTYCETCGKELSRTPVTVPAKGHTPGTPVRKNEKAATCTAAGSYTEVIYCSVCDTLLSETEISVPALGHEWGAWNETTPASCLTDGAETRVCAHDASHKQARAIPATGHIWGAWTVTKPATETEEGSETRICQNDPAHTETRAIPVLGHIHTLEKTDAKEASCTEAGNIEYWVCADCGRLFGDAEGKNALNTEDVVIPAPGHDWGEWTLTARPTFTAKGTESRTCERCLETETRYTAILGDADGDGRVTASDAHSILALVGSGIYDPAADLDADDAITGYDAALLLRRFIGG